jgi:hypothetical protein
MAGSPGERGMLLLKRLSCILVLLVLPAVLSSRLNVPRVLLPFSANPPGFKLTGKCRRFFVNEFRTQRTFYIKKRGMESIAGLLACCHEENSALT